MVPNSFEPAGLKWSFHRCRSFSLLRVGDANSAETTPDTWVRRGWPPPQFYHGIPAAAPINGNPAKAW